MNGSADVSRYRLAPAFVAALAGGLFLVVALAAIVVAVVVAVTSGPPWVLLVVAGAGLVGVTGVTAWLGRVASVVRLDDIGYRVRVARGVGVRNAAWRDLVGAAATSPAGEPCVEMRLRDGRRTTIRMRLLAADREEFARDVRDRLRDHGLVDGVAPVETEGDSPGRREAL